MNRSKPAWVSKTCFGNGLQDLVNLLLKIHVQQPISLIQHQVLEHLEVEALQGTPVRLA